MNKEWQTIAGRAVAVSILSLLCSCATAPRPIPKPAARELPVELKLDRDAGRGNLLLVTLRLESGEQLPFILDTGASGTCFDKSLEPRLGKRLGTDTSWHFGAKGDAGIYEAPKLYLGCSLLRMTGPAVATIDLAPAIEPALGPPIAGVLGMDVLEHYCIQLDFGANTIRFLNSDQADKQGWGKSYALTNLDDAYPVLNANLAGGQGAGSLLDTGCNTDGWLTAGLFDQWTNPAARPAQGLARSPDGVLGGADYTDLDLQRLGENLVASGDSHTKVNGVGLRFLARHLVTFDFPKRTLYLKRTSAGPLALNVRDQRAVGKSLFKFLKGLTKKDQLPGWSTADKFPRRANFRCHSLCGGTLHLSKQGDSSVYHYRATRASEHSPWKLRQAWRTDKDGHTMTDYAVP